MLFFPLTVALMSSAPTATPGDPTAVLASDDAWLRAWLAPLESSARAIVVGLADESPTSIDAAIEARIDSPAFRELIHHATHLLGEHVADIAAHWPSYQDQLTRATGLLNSRFPDARSDIERAVLSSRECEWALLEAQREFGLLTRGLDELSARSLDVFAALSDPALPKGLRAGLREGFRMSIIGGCLVDIAERGSRVAPELVRALCRKWHTGADAYATVMISVLSFDHPGFAGRLGLESHVDADTIAELVAWRGETWDPVLGAFADVADEVDEVTELTMQARERDPLRAPNA